MRGTPATMQSETGYGDVVSEVRSFLVERAAAAAGAGVTEVWIDPGIGFAKTAEQNLRLVARLGELVATGLPVAVGTSRKSFLGRFGAPAGGSPLPTDDRLEASLATATWAMVAGAAMVRVHDVVPTVQAAELVGALR
jgi:dihydropteroate synthase